MKKSGFRLVAGFAFGTLAACGAAGGANAQVIAFEKGNSLWSMCRHPSGTVQFSQCENYVTGAFDGTGYTTRNCPNVASVDISQVIDVTVRYLAANPQSRHLPAVFLVRNAVDRAFGCRR